MGTYSKIVRSYGAFLSPNHRRRRRRPPSSHDEVAPLLLPDPLPAQEATDITSSLNTDQFLTGVPHNSRYRRRRKSCRDLPVLAYYQHHNHSMSCRKGCTSCGGPPFTNELRRRTPRCLRCAGMGASEVMALNLSAKCKRCRGTGYEPHLPSVCRTREENA